MQSEYVTSTSTVRARRGGCLEFFSTKSGRSHVRFPRFGRVHTNELKTLAGAEFFNVSLPGYAAARVLKDGRSLLWLVMVVPHGGISMGSTFYFFEYEAFCLDVTSENGAVEDLRPTQTTKEVFHAWDTPHLIVFSNGSVCRVCDFVVVVSGVHL
jgi:hypothetical protein